MRWRWLLGVVLSVLAFGVVAVFVPRQTIAQSAPAPAMDVAVADNARQIQDTALASKRNARGAARFPPSAYARLAWP